MNAARRWLSPVVLATGGVCLSLLCPAAGLPRLAFLQITARQGERDPNEFHDSMILEGPFLPAMPGGFIKDWYNTRDYIEMSKYQCDRIRIVRFQFRVPKPAQDGKVRVEMQIWLKSPDQNHDKTVGVFFEVHNGDQVVESTLLVTKVAEGELVKRVVDLVLPVADLKADPVTHLRLTMHTKDV